MSLNNYYISISIKNTIEYSLKALENYTFLSNCLCRTNYLPKITPTTEASRIFLITTSYFEHLSRIWLPTSCHNSSSKTKTRKSAIFFAFFVCYVKNGADVGLFWLVSSQLFADLRRGLTYFFRYRVLAHTWWVLANLP